MTDTRGNIVVATDFSESSAIATRWATSLARAGHRRLVLFHAVEPPVEIGVAPEFLLVPPHHQELMVEDAEKRMNHTVAALLEEGLEASGEVKLGRAARNILEACERHAADLLVVGTRGMTGFRRLLLGSTTARVLQSAPCPTLTVHGQDGAVRRVGTVLVPTDFSTDAQVATAAWTTRSTRRPRCTPPAGPIRRAPPASASASSPRHFATRGSTWTPWPERATPPR
jgi:nucleotide-binding universal stress UspA family protein